MRATKLLQPPHALHRDFNAYGCDHALGPAEDDFQSTRNASDDPEKADAQGMTIFLLETERPLFLTDWAAEMALEADGKAARKAEMARLDNRSKTEVNEKRAKL